MAIPFMGCLSSDEIEHIHDVSMRILEDVGIEFLDDKALNLFRRAGARIGGSRVFIPRRLVEEAVRAAPKQFTLFARSPAKSVIIGGSALVFAPGYGAPFVIDMDRGRRRGTLRHYVELVQIVQSIEGLQVNGGPLVEPQDVPEGERHVEMLLAALVNSDKPLIGSAHGARARDSIRMAAVLFGGEEKLRHQPGLIALINCITPLKYDQRMLEALLTYAEYRQPVIVASFAMAGASSPVTIAGSLALQNAEILAGITLAQLASEGTPVVYGSASSIMDMRHASLAVGAPETALITAATAEMARFYRLPSRGGGALSDSKAPDAQAGYESMMNLLVAAASGINFVLHAAGILEYYMTISYEKLVIDGEIAAMVRRFANGFGVSEATTALETIAKVGPGGHYLDTDHTIKYYLSESLFPKLTDRASYEIWRMDGARTIEQKAAARWKDLLSAFEPPPLDEAIHRELVGYVDWVKKRGGTPS